MSRKGFSVTDFTAPFVRAYERISGYDWAASRWPMFLMVFGGLLILTGGFLYWQLSSGTEERERALQQGREIAEQVQRGVHAFNRLLDAPEVQSLAEMAVGSEAHLEGLRKYVESRPQEIHSVRLLEPDPYLGNVEELGNSPWAVVDMMLVSEAEGSAPAQMHWTPEGEVVLAGMASVKSDDEVLAYLLVEASAAPVLERFKTNTPVGSFIALEQNNGRQPATRLRTIGPVGDASGATRIPVPGSLLEVVIPNAPIDPAARTHRLLVAALGLLLLALGARLRFSPAGRAAAQSKQQVQVDETVESADLVPDPLPPGEPATEMEALQEDDEQDDEQDEILAMLGGPDDDLDFDDPAGNDAPATEPQSQPEPPPSAPPPPVSANDGDGMMVEELSEMPEFEPSAAAPAAAADFPPGPQPAAKSAEPVELSREIFRAYDVRGIVGKSIDSGIAEDLGRAIGSLAVDQGAAPVVVARDGRHSGPELVEGLVEGLLSTGCDVIDIGAAPTGVLYFAANHLGSGSGVMVTGSHNPPDYNGFKAMIGGNTLHGDQITGLYDRISSGDLRVGRGELTRKDMLEHYRNRIAEDIKLERRLSVVADCGNGIGGAVAADVLRDIGAEVFPLFEEVDGDFPNHHPDPSEPKNLVDLIESVRIMGADLGVAFDGDADRLGVVTPDGNIIYPDRLMMLFARDVLSRNPGATIIYDVKCTGHLADEIRAAKGEALMWKTGHSLIKAKMKASGAPLAGEMSGHFFFAERWYGFDDGIYSAARLLEILARIPDPPVEVLNELPTSVSTPELKIDTKVEGRNHEFIEKFRKSARFSDATVNTIDGLRADWEDGWGLVRASNTTPVLVCRFDANTKEALKRIQAEFAAAIIEVDPDLELPF